MARSMTNPPSAAGIALVTVVFVLCIVVAYILSTMSTYLVVGAVLGIVLFAIGFLYPCAALYILIFSMLLSPEFGSRDISGEGFTIRFEDIFLIIMGLAWLARSAIYKDISLVMHSQFTFPIVMYSLVCLVSTAVGFIRGDVRFPLTGALFVLKYFEYFFVFFIVMNNVHSRKQLRILLFALFITYFIVVIIGFSQIPSGGRITAPFEGQNGEPNTLGGYLVIMLSLNLAFLLNSRTMFRKVILGGLGFLGFVALLFTLSRASWLAAFFMYMTFIMLSRYRKTLIVLLVFGAVISPYLLPDAVINRVLYTFGTQQDQANYKMYQKYIKSKPVEYDTSTQARLNSMKKALSDFTRRPLFGYGVTGHSFLDAQFHRVLVETGMLGFVAFLYLLLIIGRNLFRMFSIYREDNLYHSLAIGAFCGFIGLVAHSFGTNTFIIVRIMEPFWCIAGLTMAIPHIISQETSDEAADRPACLTPV